jgi:hypothetical protein
VGREDAAAAAACALGATAVLHHPVGSAIARVRAPHHSDARDPDRLGVVATHGMAVARLRGVATGNIVEMIGGGAIAAALPRRGGAGAPAPHGVAAARCRHGGADHQMWSL